MSAEEIDFLTVEDLLEVAAGVLDEVAVRDAGLLAAAAGRPQVTVFGADAYLTFEEQVAALLHSLVRNHPFLDRNKRVAWADKRVAWAAARIFCVLNGRDLTYSVDDAEHMMLAAAAGTLDVPDIAAWLRIYRESVSQRRQ